MSHASPPDTSRRPKDSEREGQGYSFVSRGEMEADIRAGRYLEHGEYEGNLYGTRIDSIRGVVASGKVCVLDVNPQVLFVSLSCLSGTPTHTLLPSATPVCLLVFTFSSAITGDPTRLDPFSSFLEPSPRLLQAVSRAPTLTPTHLPVA